MCRGSLSTLRLHGWIQSKPVFTIGEATRVLEITHPTIAKSVRQLQSIGIVREISGRTRRQVFAYGTLLQILGEGTEPLK